MTDLDGEGMIVMGANTTTPLQATPCNQHSTEGPQVPDNIMDEYVI